MILAGQGPSVALAKEGQISELILTHRDRLLRFGSQLLFNICEYFDVKIRVLDDTVHTDFEKQLAVDLIEIITVFTSRLYGKRAHENRRRKLQNAA